MIHFAQQVGWLLTLALVMLLVSRLTVSLIKLVWENGLNGEKTTGEEAFRSLVHGTVAFIGLLIAKWPATAVSAALWVVMSKLGLDVWACLGFSSLNFGIAMLATAALKVKPKAVVSAQSKPA